MTTSKLPANALMHPNVAGQHFNYWVCTIPSGHAYGEMFSPAYWSHHHRLQQNDMVRVVAADGSFDLILTVRSRPAGGAMMELWPKFPSGYGSQAEAEATATAEAARPDVVPILPNGKAAVRVDNTEASKWRVIALNGEPLISGLATEAEATEKLNIYLTSLRLRLPTADEFAAAAVERDRQAAAREAAADARKAKRQRAA